jgi:hypothetical protein
MPQLNQLDFQRNNLFDQHHLFHCGELFAFNAIEIDSAWHIGSIELEFVVASF